VTGTHETVRVFALASAEMQRDLRRQLAPLGVTPVFIERAAELSYITRGRASFHVALLPAALPDADWWALWGSISLLNPRPALLVYAHTANFRLWSGVLEAGGYDVIVEPFTDREIQGAVLRAAESFEDRLRGNGNEEPG
jgi:DNA-binding NtrC family response regulator